ncbi:DUF3834 domain-containing protein [Acidianus sp. HS-5]|uniref:DUF3834 domain-containing protein n=1 Tax=Acidianus sp. HS-5 TaxID=2886040 RepID=UPI001F368042|nr:DUF3834 domain-containing protein [Acidianus sp. HS-5]BDC19380.1 hypothetical protein HS5_22700 [Acidianus sp. HS-5]
MLITTPFAGPVSFPLLVAKELGGEQINLKNSCETNEVGDIILDAITNIAKLNLMGYKIVAGVYIDMYTILGNRNSTKIYTIREGTLADINARLYAKYTNKDVINTDAKSAVKKAEEGNLAIVGIEVKMGEKLEDEFERLGIRTPSCVIYSKVDPTDVLKLYEKGIRIIKEDPINSAKVISSLSKYYSLSVMESIINHYSHKLITNSNELKKSIEVYSQIVPSVAKLELGLS